MLPMGNISQAFSDPGVRSLLRQMGNPGPSREGDAPPVCAMHSCVDAGRIGGLSELIFFACRPQSHEILQPFCNERIGFVRSFYLSRSFA